MDIFAGILVGIFLLLLLAFIFEYRVRRPDVVVLSEKNGSIKVRGGLFYPRHFSLPLERTAQSIQLNTEISATGNLVVSVKLVGSAAPSLEHLDSLVRAGGWNVDAVGRAAAEAQVLLQGLLQNYAEHQEIQALSSQNILDYLNAQADLFKEKFGLEMISLGILALEPTDPEIISALRQQEQARLLEETEMLNHKARLAAAKAKYQTDEEIARMEHDLDLKKTELNKALIAEEALVAEQRLEHELARSRMRLAFEQEELETLKRSPELLMLTPQAARLAEASQNLKNARTIVSFTPQELAQGSELLELFQAMLQKALDIKKEEHED